MKADAQLLIPAHPPSDPVEEEDDFLALRRDVPRQLDDPLLLVVLHIQSARGKTNRFLATPEAIHLTGQIVFARIHFRPKLLSFHEDEIEHFFFLAIYEFSSV